MDNDAPCQRQVWWFAETFTTDLLPPYWEVNKEAQRDITCYELLAQIALLWARGQHFQSATCPVFLSSACDNTGAEAVANRMFTTAVPL